MKGLEIETEEGKKGEVERGEREKESVSMRGSLRDEVHTKSER